ncbi:type II secretion system protein N [Photobacterium sp. 1_MG-2023]|uniref:type II secretion system protein N n=1 Tax=Photobacterium sp. 1_MG-2023 TaxID=3062646 RepID=UPI0026E2B502|nr:type II secretion system protein N [Photobacterium sp. 1_MG-2023]MDO6707485.1 type II secretion system protein N [Photobacterium sp. 1_MG-2023]
MHLPASWLWQFVPSPPGLTVTGIKGTLWDGNASQARWQQWDLGEVGWEMSPWKLLTGHVLLDVTLGRGSPLDYRGKGLLGVNFDGPYAKDFSLHLSAQQVSQLMPLPVPLTLGGSFELQLSEYRFAPPYCETLDGQLIWHGASIGTPLGEIDPDTANAMLSCNDGQLMATIKQESSQVTSEWQASLSPNQTYHLNGWFKPGAELPGGLRDQLKWVGNPDADGRYPIRYSGRL